MLRLCYSRLTPRPCVTSLCAPTSPPQRLTLRSCSTQTLRLHSTNGGEPLKSRGGRLTKPRAAGLGLRSSRGFAIGGSSSTIPTTGSWITATLASRTDTTGSSSRNVVLGRFQQGDRPKSRSIGSSAKSSVSTPGGTILTLKSTRSNGLKLTGSTLTGRNLQTELKNLK